MMVGMGLGMVDRDIEVGKEYKVGTFTLNGVTYDRYVKIVDYGALPNATTKNVAHGITYTGIINTHGVAKNNTNIVIPLPYITGSTTMASYYITSASIYAMTATDLSVYHAYVTIEYYR